MNSFKYTIYVFILLIFKVDKLYFMNTIYVNLKNSNNLQTRPYKYK